MYLQIFQTLIRKNQCPISRMSTQFRSLLLTLLLLTLPPILEEHEKHLFLSPPHSWNPNPMEEPISPIFLVYIILNFRWLFKIINTSEREEETKPTWEVGIIQITEKVPRIPLYSFIYTSLLLGWNKIFSFKTDSIWGAACLFHLRFVKKWPWPPPAPVKKICHTGSASNTDIQKRYTCCIKITMILIMAIKRNTTIQV